MASNAPPTVSTWYERRAFIALLIGVAAVFTNIYATQPILPLLSSDFAVSPARSGLSISAVVLGIALAALVLGPLSDRTGRKPIMVWTSFALVIPTFGAALATSFDQLLLFRVLQGLLIPGTTAVGIAFIQDYVAREARGSAMGAYVSATVVGGLFGRMQSAAIADLWGWRWAFAALGFTTLTSAVLMTAWLPGRSFGGPHEPAAGGGSLRATYLGLLGFFRLRRIVGASIVGHTLFFTFTGLLTFLSYRLAGPPFRLSTGAIGLIYLTYLVGMVVTPWVGKLSDRFGRRAVLGGAVGLIAAGALATAAPRLPVVALGLMLLSSGMFAAQATATAYVGDNAGQARGGAASFYLLWYYLGATISPALAGLAWQRAGWTGVLELCLATLGIGLVALIGLCG